MIVAILGESGSGKTTLAKKVGHRQRNWSRIISYTTRPQRKDEKNGIDYIFTNKEIFNLLKEKKHFSITTNYNDWSYGIPKLSNKKNKIIILTPKELRVLKNKNIYSERFLSFYLNVDRRSRLLKLLERGDNIDEAYRRNLSEQGQFDGIENEVDYVIYNNNYTKNEETVFNEFKNKIREKTYDRNTNFRK